MSPTILALFLFSVLLDLIHGKAKSLGNTLAVVGVSLVELLGLENLDLLVIDGSQGVLDGLDQAVLLFRAHQPVETAGCGIVVLVIGAGVFGLPLDGIAVHPGIVVFHGAALAVGLVVDRSILTLRHETVSFVVVDLVDWPVDGQLFVVGAQTITLGVLVSEQAALQQLVGRGLDAGDEVGGGEGRFLHIIKVVGRVGVQHELAYLNARIVLLGDHLGHVEDIVLVVQALLVGQDLHADLPLGVVAPVDGIV